MSPPPGEESIQALHQELGFTEIRLGTKIDHVEERLLTRIAGHRRESDSSIARLEKTSELNSKDIADLKAWKLQVKAWLVAAVFFAAILEKMLSFIGKEWVK